MSDRVFVPPIKIQGIKTKLVPTIKDNVEVGGSTLWLEPFMGSGVVGFNIRPERAVFADINPHIINFYNAVKSGAVTAERARVFLEEQGALLAERDGEYYYQVRDRFNAKHDPLDFLFLNRSCYNGVVRFNKAYQFNVPYGHKPQRFAKAYITKIANQIQYIEDCLGRYDWTFVCQPFADTIAMADERAFIYCDPPYIGRHVDYYDSWDEPLELALCRSLRSSGARFMLSTWDHNAYRSNGYLESVWGFCHKLNQEHYYHVGARESNRSPMVESLLTNYEPRGGRSAPAREYEQLQLSLA